VPPGPVPGGFCRRRQEILLTSVLFALIIQMRATAAGPLEKRVHV